MEKRQEPQHAVLLTHIAEKDFTFSEQMDLSPGREGAAELLTSQVCRAVTETKIVGSKLIFKGLFHVSLLYRTADGSCCSASGELPFSQIMEVEGAPEGAEPTVQLQLTGADLQIDGGDAEGREIAVTLYLHATALLRQSQELTLLSDLYSTAYDLTYEAAPLELTSFRQQLTRRQTVREVLEIGVVAESILALSVTCGAVSVSREGETAVLRTGRWTCGPCIWTRGACRWWQSGPWTSPASWSCRRTAGSPPGPSARRRSRAAWRTGASRSGSRWTSRRRRRQRVQAGVRVRRQAQHGVPQGHRRGAVPGAAVPGQAGDRLGPGEAV